jgi:glycosyltransferase involved in cell wall biosynthesis
MRQQENWLERPLPQAISTLPVSVCLLVLNEEDRLERTLAPLGAFYETIVLDSGSTDRSIEICKAHGARVYQEKWQGFGKMRQKLFSLGSQPWIFWLDADEVVRDELVTELRDLFSRPILFDAFMINRMVYFEDRWIRHGDWFPDWTTRLFKANSWSMEPREVHESIRINGSVGRLKGFLEHHTYRNWDDQRRRSQRYATLWANQMANRGDPLPLGTPRVRGCWRFFKGYVLKRGFLDGLLGLRIAFANARETVLKHELLRAALQERQNEQ